MWLSGGAAPFGNWGFATTEGERVRSLLGAGARGVGATIRRTWEEGARRQVSRDGAAGTWGEVSPACGRLPFLQCPGP